MANQGLFDQVKDFLLGHPDTPGAMETLPAPELETAETSENADNSENPENATRRPEEPPPV